VRLIADGKTPQKIVKRASIVLLSGRGLGTNAICREARVSKPTVWRWQKAYMEGGVERLLKDKGKGPRAGKKRRAGLVWAPMHYGRNDDAIPWSD
jgi:transposase